jgi:hypothetical protein
MGSNSFPSWKAFFCAILYNLIGYPFTLFIAATNLTVADSAHRAVEGVGLQPLNCWDRGFESRRGHGCLSLVSVACCVSSDLSDGLITRSGQSYRCMSNCV